jgi:hypothetical protein
MERVFPAMMEVGLGSNLAVPGRGGEGLEINANSPSDAKDGLASTADVGASGLLVQNVS